MATKLNTAAKIAIWAGILATVGVTGVLIYKGYQKWKSNRDFSNTDDSDINTPNDSSNSTISPKDTTTATDIKNQSFEAIKTALGSGVKVYPDYVTITARPTTFGLNESALGGSGTRIQAKFQKDGGYRLYVIPSGSSQPKLLHGGLYWNAGKKLQVYNDFLNGGKNKGLIVESSTPLNALIKASKS